MKLLITGAWRCTREQLDSVARLGHQVYFLQQESEALPLAYDAVDGVICNGLFLHHPIEKFTRLRYIQLTSAGFDRIPMDYVKSHGIEIHNARGVYSIPMAEFALSGVLQLYKQSRFFLENQKQHRWEKHRGLLELYGKQVCIVGCGSVGTECARRFGAFGCIVTGVDLYPRVDANYICMEPMDLLEDVLAESDIVVLTLPLTAESRRLIDEARLAKMKPGTVIVNIARGGVVDNAALTDWLKEGRGAAVLDVFEEEPLEAEDPLWEMENVVLTPHNSFAGEGNSQRLLQVIIDNLERKEQHGI